MFKFSLLQSCTEPAVCELWLVCKFLSALHYTVTLRAAAQAEKPLAAALRTCQPSTHTVLFTSVLSTYLTTDKKKNYHFTKSDILIWFVLKITELFFPQYLPRHVNCKSQVIPSASTQTIFVSIHYNTQLSYMFQPFCAIIKHTSYKSWTATVLAQLSILTNTH